MDLMDYTMAIQYYRHLLDKDPGRKGLRTEMAFALIQLGEHQEVEPLLQEESKRFPQDREPLVLLAYFYFQDNDCARVKDVLTSYDKLVQREFRKAGLGKAADKPDRQGLQERMVRSRLEKEPNLGLPYYALGYCLKRTGQFGQAREEFERASVMGYDATACRLQLVDIALEAGDWQGALSLLRNAEETLSVKPEYAFLEACAYNGMGKTEEAIRAFRAVCELKPQWAEALKNLARLYSSRGETSEAEAFLERVRALSPGQKDVLKDIDHTKLSRAFIDELKPALRDSFRSGKEAVIRDADARFLGLLHKGSLNEAADYLSRFLILHDRDAGLSFKLANLLNELGRCEESLRLAARVLELERDHKGAWDLRGDILFRIGDYVHSVQAYQEVVRISPDDAMGHYNLGCAQDAVGDSKQAEVHWRKVLQLERPRSRGDGIKESEETLQYSVDVYAKPPSFHARLALGRLYSREGLTAQATQELEEAVKLVPNEPDAYFDMGEAYMKMQDRQKAAACFKKYLALGGKREQEVRAFLRILKPD
jgi:tetratricopeptide (TPR) repeat protein